MDNNSLVPAANVALLNPIDIIKIYNEAPCKLDNVIEPEYAPECADVVKTEYWRFYSPDSVFGMPDDKVEVGFRHYDKTTKSSKIGDTTCNLARLQNEYRTDMYFVQFLQQEEEICSPIRGETSNEAIAEAARTIKQLNRLNRQQHFVLLQCLINVAIMSW